ncbi:MAG: hypothetical protein J0G96_01805 [Flavobacteriia bacterium]|nr:hypothetical protein [Flavobacteriia bacterium]
MRFSFFLQVSSASFFEEKLDSLADVLTKLPKVDVQVQVYGFLQAAARIKNDVVRTIFLIVI